MNNNIDNAIMIHSETFDRDFDEVGWDPVKVDDSNAEAAEMFDY